MAHTVRYNPDLQIIVTWTQGEVTLSESKEIISEIIQLAVAQNCFLCLGDFRDETIKLSTLEIYDLPKIISNASTAQGIPASRFKRAIVVKQGWNDFHFYETVTLNHRQNIKLFEDIEEAKRWLLEP
jgi:hypothetical protein